MPSRAAQRKIDLQIDRIVERLNQLPHERMDPEDVPPALRVGPEPEDIFEAVSWAIHPAPSPCAWIAEFEAKLPGRLPPSFRSLVSRYLFPTLAVGPVMLFANTGAAVHDELVEAVFRDRGIYEPTLAAGFVQFGRPSTGIYDPVCFDLNRRRNDGECPVLQVDHEVALMQGRVKVLSELAPSFLTLFEE